MWLRITHILWLEYPMWFAIIIYIVPPAKSHEQPSWDVFDSPEIGRKKKDNEYKACDEGVTKPAAEHVNYNRCSAEKQVEEGDIRMPASSNRRERKKGVSQMTHTQTEHLLTCISGPAHWDRAFHLPRRMVSYHRRVMAPAQQQNIINLTTAPGSIGEEMIFLLAFYFTLLLFLVFDGSCKSNCSVFVC